MLSLSIDQNIQNYNTCQDYIRGSTKLQHLLTCRRKRQMLKKTSDPTPPEAGSETNKRCLSNKRPHLASHAEEDSIVYHFNYQSATNLQPTNYYQHGETNFGVRTNKMMKFKHAGLDSESNQVITNFGHQQLNQTHRQKYGQQSITQFQPKNLEKSHKQSISSGHNVDADTNSKHLVRSVSDLPVFVTIEGYRVASYSIGGEPHLCLPQLLQFLKQNFTIKRLIDKFEESVVTFPSATPKQVEGFVKSCVLPPSATSCPLIKRSDADKICLGLYEQCSKALRSDIVKLCSQQVPNFGEGSGNKLPQNKSPVTNSVNLQSQTQVFSQAIKSESDNKDNNQDNSSNKSDSSYGPIPINYNKTPVGDSKTSGPVDTLKTSSMDQLCINNQQQQRPVSIIKGTLDSKSLLDNNCNDDNQLEQISSGGNESIERSYKSDSEIIKKPPLFESEAQNSILALARAITSTLIIRVYHKCFGKCLGLYYPSLLINCNSKCIECANCKLMLSPRRFIGHTHGSKEKDLCHWGFNSYNWRSYIRLSRKQTQNNLDDDELLIQFRTLLSVSNDGVNENDNDDYEFDKQEPDESYSIYGNKIKETNGEQHISSNIPSSRAQKRKHTINQAPPTPLILDKSAPNRILGSTSVYECSSADTSSHYNLSGDSPLYLPLPDKVDLSNAKSSLGIPPLLPVPIPLTSDAMPSIYAHSQPSQSHHHQQQQQVAPRPVPASQRLALPSADAYYSFPWTPLAAQAGPAQPSIYTSPFEISDPRDRSQQPLSASKRSSSFSTSNASNSFWPSARSTSVACPGTIFNTEQLTRQLLLDSETKREIYICNNLTSYLGNKGLSLGLTNDIVETTLNIVRRSKTLF